MDDSQVLLIDRQLAFQRVTWSRLWEVEAPDPLADERASARRDVEAMLAAFTRWRNAIAAEPDAFLLSEAELNDLAARTGTLDEGARATASLSDLAGRSCTAELSS